MKDVFYYDAVFQTKNTVLLKYTSFFAVVFYLFGRFGICIFLLHLVFQFQKAFFNDF